MSWCNKIFAVFLCCIFMQGCGFQPLHGNVTADRSTVAEFRNMSIANIPERNGQMLRNALIDRFYGGAMPPAAPRYRLEITHLQEEGTSLGVQKDATVTRMQLRSSARLDLIDTQAEEERKIVMRRYLRTLNSYNVLESQFATLTAAQQAREAGLNELADQAATELALYFSRRRP